MKTAEQLKQKRAELLAKIARTESECEEAVYREFKLVLEDKIEKYFASPTTHGFIERDFKLKDSNPAFKGLTKQVVIDAANRIVSEFRKSGFFVRWNGVDDRHCGTVSISLVLEFDMEATYAN